MRMNTYSKNGHTVLNEQHSDFDYESLDGWDEEDKEPTAANKREYQRIYAEVASRQFDVMNRILGRILSAPNPKNAAWQIALAMGSHHCEGKTQTQIAAECGVTRAAMSAGAVDTCRAFGWPESRYMKSEESRQAFSERRRQNLKPAE
jgi:hypothetical protein